MKKNKIDHEKVIATISNIIMFCGISIKSNKGIEYHTRINNTQMILNIFPNKIIIHYQTPVKNKNGLYCTLEMTHKNDVNSIEKDILLDLTAISIELENI